MDKALLTKGGRHRRLICSVREDAHLDKDDRDLGEYGSDKRTMACADLRADIGLQTVVSQEAMKLPAKGIVKSNGDWATLLQELLARPREAIRSTLTVREENCESSAGRSIAMESHHEVGVA